MKQVTAVVLGAGGRGRAYAQYALDFPNELNIVAVAEPDETRRRTFAEMHAIAENRRYEDWETLLSQPRMADAVLICTQDRMHYEPALLALEQGYHVLLEKPMSNDLRECVSLAEAAKQYERVFSVCHVLRYTPFFSTLKRVIEEGRIGELVTIDMIENVGYWHQAHSFVRGNWSKAGESNPMIMAKSCHDMDILVWLAGADCSHLTSYGGLKHFTKENAPEGAPLRCLDGCPARDTCAYYAPDIYFGVEDARGLSLALTNDDSVEGIMEALRTGPYGRCVYHCDNDVVDHQVVAMEFENRITATFTMTAFTTDGGRTVKLMGTKGQIRAHMGKGVIDISDFKTGRIETIQLAMAAHGHGGGDRGIMKDFSELVRSGAKSESLSSAAVSVQSHVMAFAAEKSRLDRRSIRIQDYMRKATEGVFP